MKKIIVPILWIMAMLTFLVTAVIAQSQPFDELGSGIAFFIFSTFILIAMLIQTLRNKANNLPNMFMSKMIFVIAGFIYNIYHLVSRLLNI